jgi:hypothetical protein
MAIMGPEHQDQHEHDANLGQPEVQRIAAGEGTEGVPASAMRVRVSQIRQLL